MDLEIAEPSLNPVLKMHGEYDQVAILHRPGDTPVRRNTDNAVPAVLNRMESSMERRKLTGVCQLNPQGIACAQFWEREI